MPWSSRIITERLKLYVRCHLKFIQWKCYLLKPIIHPQKKNSLFKFECNHGGESRDLNDRVGGIRTKHVNKLITLFLIPNRFS